MTFAIQGIPRKWSLKLVRSTLQQDLNLQINPLYFDIDNNKFKKFVYVQLLSEDDDPAEAVRIINSLPKYRKMKFNAFVPKYVSQAHIAAGKKPTSKAGPMNERGPPTNIPHDQGHNATSKKHRGPRTKRGLPANLPYDQMLAIVHREIMTELQAKYTRLYNLSRKTPGNLLLENIARIIFERVKTIMETNDEALSTCFKLSSYYRRLHPHFGDFQMILSTLHKIQDGHGLARTELVESEMINVSTQLYVIDNVPYDKIKCATDKYAVRITKRVLEHIRKLNAEPHQMDTEEDGARKKVRHELKSMAQHLPAIIRQVIQKHLTPEKAPFHRVRIYGEPFLPSKDQMVPFTKRFKAVHIVRSDRMYNLLKMNVPPAQYSSLMSMDGHVVGGAKLVIRSSDIPLYKVPAELRAAFGVGHLADVEMAEHRNPDAEM